MMGTVYIIRGVLKTDFHKIINYVGYTNRSFVERLREHQTGLSTFTSRYTNLSPVVLIDVPNSNAVSVEHYIKTHYRVKVALIGRDEDSSAFRSFSVWCLKHKIPVKVIYSE